MSLILNGDTGVSMVQSGVVEDADLNLSVKPMFSAYQSVAQTFVNGTNPVVNFQTKEFDTTDAYNTSTMRFTPQKQGYYQVSARVGSAVTSVPIMSIVKNGATVKDGTSGPVSGAVNSSAVSAIVFMNGSTDYLTISSYVVTGGALNAAAQETYFQAHYIGA